MILGVQVFEHFIIRLQYAKILGHLKIINFPFGTNEKLMVLSVPIFKHFRVCISKAPNIGD